MIDPENPEWTDEDFAAARPAKAAISPVLLGKLGVRGPQKAPTKEQISIRLSREVLEGFRSMGEGWQGRIDGVLQDWLSRQKPA